MGPEWTGIFALILVSAVVCKILFDKKCPKYRMVIPRSASICPHCRTALS
jgi:hypothetical protein